MMLSFVFRSTMSLAACLVPRSVQDVPVRLIAGRPSRRIGGQWRGAGDGEQPVASATRNVGTLIGVTAAQAMARGILFAGSPDTVYEQIMSFYKAVGGFGHLTMVAGPAS